MEDVAFDTCGILQHDLVGTDDAFHLAANHDRISNYVAIDRCISTDDELRAANVAIYLTVDLEVVLTLQIASDHQACVYDRLG